MTGQPPRPASRTRKARRSSVCPLCRAAPIYVGQVIGLVRGLGWAHVSCIIEYRRAALDEVASVMTTPPQPGRAGLDLMERSR